MSSPCIQGERIAKAETQMESIMERLDKIETKQDVTNEGIHDIKNQLASMSGTFVHRDEFEEMKEKQDGMRNELTEAKGFIFGAKAVLAFLGLGSLAGAYAFLKLVVKLF